MKIIYPVLLFLIIFLNSVLSDETDVLDNYPHYVITNGIIQTSLFKPDKEKGFYRSTRFDWSGMIFQLTYRGHSYFLLDKEKNPLPLRQVHDPEKPNHASGTSEEFSEIERVNKKKEYETRMKIGIGNIDKNGIIVDSGEWSVKNGRNYVVFTHILKDSYGYGYKYTKRVELTLGKPELVISFDLKNTGKKRILTSQYSHNFFNIDNDYIGNNYELELFFPAKYKLVLPKSFQNDFFPYVVLEDNKLIFLKDLILFEGEGTDYGIYTRLTGFGDSVSENRCILKNKRTGAGVDISGDFPLSAFNFWADISTICPESFIDISIAPGESKKWKRVYHFFIN